MRFLTIIFTTFILSCCVQNKGTNKIVSKNDTYNIILRTELLDPEKDQDTEESYTTEIPGKIDQKAIEKLNEPLIALTAFYSAMGGTMCSGDYCDLTTALGLGKQGSEKQKNLIINYFPKDKVAEAVLKQDCYLRPSGASSFSDFEFLTIIDKGDTVNVDYNLMTYNRGEIKWVKGPDAYLFKDNKFIKLNRNLWTFADQ